MSYAEEFIVERSAKIQPGAQYTLYLVYCTDCNEYRTIYASPPMGPGGTLSCPVCKSRNQNGPHIEGAYGNVKSKPLEIKLPEFTCD
jgi:hypothetical protein